MTMETLNFDINGMTCGGCTSGVHRAIGKLDGITRADVILHPGMATVTFDPLRVMAAQIAAAVSKLGYSAKVRP